MVKIDLNEDKDSKSKEGKFVLLPFVLTRIEFLNKLISLSYVLLRVVCSPYVISNEWRGRKERRQPQIILRSVYNKINLPGILCMFSYIRP